MFHEIHFDIIAIRNRNKMIEWIDESLLFLQSFVKKNSSSKESSCKCIESGFPSFNSQISNEYLLMAIKHAGDEYSGDTLEATKWDQGN